MSKPKYYTVSEVMEVFRVKKRETILRWIHSGKLEAIKAGNKYLIHQKALDLYHGANVVIGSPPC